MTAALGQQNVILHQTLPLPFGDAEIFLQSSLTLGVYELRLEDNADFEKSLDCGSLRIASDHFGFSGGRYALSDSVVIFRL
jgi:hypothetical protein